MNLNIEISEEEIQKVVKDRIREVLEYSMDIQSYIRGEVTSQWCQETISRTVRDFLNDTTLLRIKVMEEVEKKLKNKIAAAIKEKGGL